MKYSDDAVEMAALEDWDAFFADTKKVAFISLSEFAFKKFSNFKILCDWKSQIK